ncbi:MAG: hypothetical protein EPO28_10140 [Saprospiraceae bacterium]|nr:MAG: hypothetical protein EPO28_10140 [Saprospiraceae bacterium]
MDFYKYRRRIAFWSALAVAAMEIARQWALGDYVEIGDASIDFTAVFVCNWLIWRFNFFVDDFQQRLNLSSHPRLFFFRALLIFTVGTAIVLIIESLVHQFFREPSDNVWFYFLRGIFHNILILVIYFSLQTEHRRRNIALENAQLKEESIQAQLKLLGQQVNPHFLFNALNTLKSMARNNDPQVTDFVTHLSSLYRYLLQNNPRQQVTLIEELDMLKSYAFLLKTRFAENFNLHIDLAESLMSNRIPPLTFQLLLENAVKHNIMSAEKPLLIEIYCHDENHIAVRNNLQIRRSVEAGTGTGLENINLRYQLLTGQNIAIEKTEQSFTVVLPIIWSK